MAALARHRRGVGAGNGEERSRQHRNIDLGHRGLSWCGLLGLTRNE
jgi:hypothetical protein